MMSNGKSLAYTKGHCGEQTNTSGTSLQGKEISNTGGKVLMAQPFLLVQNEATEVNVSKHDGSGDIWEMHLAQQVTGLGLNYWAKITLPSREK